MTGHGYEQSACRCRLHGGRSRTGFDWGDAGIGAAILFALVLLVMGSSAITRRHKPAMG